MSGSISGIGGGFEALRGYGPVNSTPLLGQTSQVGAANKTAAPAGDRSSFSAELNECEGGANTLLAAWGASGANKAAPSLAVQGIEPGAKSGFNVVGGQVGGLEPGAQAGGVMLGPVLRN